VGAISGRRVTQAQAVPDHEDDAADDPAVIDPRSAVRQRKIGLDPAHLRLAQQPKLRHKQHRISPAIGAGGVHRTIKLSQSGQAI
jgi:hypothetical protein